MSEARQPDGPVWRIGVDIGGTFTDLVAISNAGTLRVVKVPSTPVDPGEAVLNGLDQLIDLLGGDHDLLRRCRLFVHGSTVATNTLLEHKGARVGLFTTNGFRDSLEIRRGIREDPWRHREPYPPVLVPRYLRLPVAGRITADGKELSPLCLDDVRDGLERMRAEGVEAIAVCLFNSVFEAGHERQLAGALRGEIDGPPLYLSSAIAPVLGEYERSSTVVLHAYVGPRTVRYIESLSGSLGARGLSTPMLLTQNNGGTVTADQVRDRPASLLLSGPAAAVGALQYLRSRIGSDDLISMEIGGTSCDLVLMSGGDVQLSEALEVGGYFLAAPSIDIQTIGAGGGTIARIDEGGLLSVGPEGAGADPGPASYGLGGSAATVTDAHLLLGRLAPGRYAGGAVTLAGEPAAEAVGRLATALSAPAEKAAQGIISLLEQKLFHALERLSVEQGHDPRDFTLVAAGGAGPMHGASVGRLLRCPRVYIPRLAGAFCAFGMLNSDVRYDRSQVFLAELDGAEPDKIDAVFRRMRDELEAALRASGFESAAYRHGFDMRYRGQQWDVGLDVGAQFCLPELRERFEERHQRLFGHVQPGGTIEITKLRLSGIGMVEPVEVATGDAARGDASPRSWRQVWIDERQGWVEAPVFEGPDLSPGHRIEGPAIVNEATTTVLLGPGDLLVVDPSGNFAIDLNIPVEAA